MQGICSNCYNLCQVKIIDLGIGHYEYWGAIGNDTQPEAVSNCCEVPAYEIDEHSISHNPRAHFITIQMLENEKYNY